MASVTVTSKALCDDCQRSAYYASIAGMVAVDLNKLELELLDLIDWDVAVSDTVVQDYYYRLVRYRPTFEFVPEDKSSR